MKHKIVTLLLSIAFSNLAFGYACEGKVDNLQVAANGVVQIMSVALYGDSAGRSICNVSSTWKGVTTESCKTWISMILVSQSTDTNISIVYDDGLSCSTQPTWGNANAPFLLDRK